MKTSDSIEQQPERKAARDNRDHSIFSPACKLPVGKKTGRGDVTRIARWQWKPGQSGNPTGKAGRHDLAAEIARAAFENNAEALYKAFSKALLKGNAYAFKELSDRAYGRLKETYAHEISAYRELSDADLKARIAQLEKELGVPSEPALLPPASDDSKPN